MKLEELVGKKAIRVKAVWVNDRTLWPSMESNQHADLSYCSKAVQVLEVKNELILCKDDGKAFVMSPRYRDEFWTEWPEEWDLEKESK